MGIGNEVGLADGRDPVTDHRPIIKICRGKSRDRDCHTVIPDLRRTRSSSTFEFEKFEVFVRVRVRRWTNVRVRSSTFSKSSSFFIEF